LTNVRLRLKRQNWWRKVAPAMENLGLLTASPQPYTQAEPPWRLPPPIDTLLTDISKDQRTEQQKEPALKTINELGPVDLQHFTDGLTHEGTKNGGAGLVVMQGNDCLHRWSGPKGRWSSSFQAEKSAMQQVFARLEEAPSWSTALVLCDCKSLVSSPPNRVTSPAEDQPQAPW